MTTSAPSRTRVLLGLGLAVSLAVAGAVFAGPANLAYAVSFPSWADVQKAKQNAGSVHDKIVELKQTIAELQDAADAATKVAEAKGADYEKKQEAFAAADRTYQALSQEAAADASAAHDAELQAGRLAAQLYQTGNQGLTMSIFLAGGDQTGEQPSDLLGGLALSSKLAEQLSGVYQNAQVAMNVASASADRAAAAKKVRADAEATAQAAFQDSLAAQQDAQAKVDTANAHVDTLRAQLQYLNDKTNATYKKYKQGVAYRAQQAEILRKKMLAGRSAVSSQGWAIPVYGPITDGFGPRVSPCFGCTSYHLGVDIGAAQGTVMHAAATGTVEYAGWNGGYGNFVLIDNGTDSNGDKVETGYGHIMPGGIMVKIGQHVDAGQAIAKVGTTGNSTGPHLHFEVRINGSQIDGQPWMRAHGAPLGLQ